MSKTFRTVAAVAALGLAAMVVPPLTVGAQDPPVCEVWLAAGDGVHELCARVASVPTSTPEPTATPVPPTPEPTPEPTATAVPPPTPTATPIPPTPTPAPPSGAWVETFDSPASLDRFVWQLHYGGESPHHPSWLGDHDLDCNGPTTSRVVNIPDTPEDRSNVGDAAYWCSPGNPTNGHLMTSIDTNGYEHVDFAPAQIFPQVNRVCWDQNINDLGRKWTQVTVVSETSYQAGSIDNPEDNNPRALDYILPHLDGPGRPGAGGVRLGGDDFLFSFRAGGTSVYVGRNLVAENNTGFTIEDRGRRFTTCIEDLENGTIRAELERETDTEVRILAGAMPDGPARVIFQDVTYNAGKNGAPASVTWHWDDLIIE